MIEIQSEENKADNNTGRNREVKEEVSHRRRSSSRRASGSSTTQATTTSIRRTTTLTATTTRWRSTTSIMATTLRNTMVIPQTSEESIAPTRKEALLIFADSTVTTRSTPRKLPSRTTPNTPSSKRSSTIDQRELSKESKTRAIRKTRQSLHLCQLSSNKEAPRDRDQATEI